MSSTCGIGKIAAAFFCKSKPRYTVLYPLLQEKLVDEFIIQIAPSIIGHGIPLFIPGEQENQLRLLDVKQYKQMAELHYELK
ncbi:dihydrofolate reductase family protein [Alicyclobacillus sacchari]|uniref:dihydrofolate reductase family protein n=1 Tax=Alicyclobacillus sacchari TaxID=392010 RepID=UPI0010652788|nr:dihydrofolate reductase family protein [Alicyclobacillus sacchari]